MKIITIKELMNADVIWGEEHLGEHVYSACGSDMMSDVLAYVKDQAVLLTGLVNSQVIRTAEMMDMRCIIFVRGKVVDEMVKNLAEQMGVTIATTQCTMFTACGRLYGMGIRGARER